MASTPSTALRYDRLVELASPGDFQPREILREVIRAPLEIAEEELPSRATFPSDAVRPDPGRHAEERSRSRCGAPSAAQSRRPGAELSLRAFYAQSPPTTDPELKSIAQYFGVQLTQGVADVQDEQDQQPNKKGQQPESRKPTPDEIEQWANGAAVLSSSAALRIRRWVCEAVIAHLQNGPYGLAISSPRRNEWRIGSHVLRTTDVVIERAQGGGAVDRPNPFRIDATDENAILLRGILAVTDGISIDAIDQGTWFFHLQTRISDYANTVARLARADAVTSLPAAVQTLAVLRYAATDPGQTVRDALAAMLMPVPPQRQNPVVRDFLMDARPIRDEALAIFRDHATAAKGAGKPSLLDVGPIYQIIRSHLRTRSVDGPSGGDDDGAPLLRRLQTRQSWAFARVWADVTRAVEEVARFLDPAEDLAATLKIVDRLVKDGHARGKLPRADSQAVYDEARDKVGVDMMEVYRRLSKKVADKAGPGDLWIVFDDPLPELNLLGHYAAVADDLLSGLAATLAETPGGGEVADTEAVIAEFRKLADVLDDVVSQEGR